MQILAEKNGPYNLQKCIVLDSNMKRIVLMFTNLWQEAEKEGRKEKEGEEKEDTCKAWILSVSNLHWLIL